MGDKIVFGKGFSLSGDEMELMPNRNQIVVGTTGSGKTVSVLLPTILGMQSESFIATFAKPGEARNLANYMKTKGYEMDVLDFTCLENSTCRFEPLAYLHSFLDIEELASSIVLANPDYKDPRHAYWNDAACNLVSALVEGTMRTEEEYDFSKVIDLFNVLKIEEDGKAIKCSLDSFFEAIRKNVPDSPAVAYYDDFCQLPYTTAGCCRDSMAKAIRKMFPPNLKAHLACRDKEIIDFREFARKKKGLVIIVSPVNRSLYLFANMVMNTAIKELMEEAQNREESVGFVRTRLFFDDFAHSPVEGFDKKISIFREAGLAVTLMIQSESQLTDAYGCGANTIVNNCASYLYFSGGNDLNTCRQVAEKIDASLQSILFSPVGKVIVMSAGRMPMILDRYETYKSEEYKAYADFIASKSLSKGKKRFAGFGRHGA